MVFQKFVYGRYKLEVVALRRKLDEKNCRMRYYESKYREWEFQRDYVQSRIQYYLDLALLEKGGKMNGKI